MSKYLLAYVGTALSFCLLDFAWLGLIAPKFYQAQIGPLLLQKPNLVAALAFYVIYVAGLVIFVVIPGAAAESWAKSALLGALFGLVAYATYDLSNLATLKGWTLPITLTDITWGTILSACAGTCGYFAFQFSSNRIS